MDSRGIHRDIDRFSISITARTHVRAFTIDGWIDRSMVVIDRDVSARIRHVLVWIIIRARACSQLWYILAINFRIDLCGSRRFVPAG